MVSLDTEIPEDPAIFFSQNNFWFVFILLVFYFKTTLLDSFFVQTCYTLATWSIVSSGFLPNLCIMILSGFSFFKSPFWSQTFLLILTFLVCLRCSPYKTLPSQFFNLSPFSFRLQNNNCFPRQLFISVF